MDRTLIWLILLLTSTLCSYAQTKVITWEEFDSKVQKSIQLLKDRDFRRVQTKYAYVDNSGKPFSTSTDITEIVSPNKTHFISEFVSPDVSSRTESIWVDGKGYERKDNGPWQTIKPGAGMGGGYGNGSGGGVTIIYRDCGIVSEEGVNGFHLYEEAVKVVYPFNGRQWTRTETTRYWYRSDGLLVKRITESSTEGTTMFSKEVVIYDYDAKLKIVAPNLP